MTNWLIRHTIKDYENTRDLKVRERYGTVGSAGGIVVNVLLSSLKFAIGLLSHSLAVTADAVNNLSDASGAVVSLVTTRIAAKPVDQEHPFGHGRMEYVGSLVIGGLIILAGVQLLEESVKGILHPAPISGSSAVVLVLCLSILLKGWLHSFYKKLGRAVDSEPLIAESKDSLSDMIGTAAILVSLLFQFAYGWHIDGWMSLVVAILILRTGIGVCHDTVDLLLGSEPDPLLVEEIKDKMLSHPEIQGVHDLIIHDYGPGRTIVTAHAEVAVDSNIVQIHEVIDKAEREIGQSLHLTICIHMDPTVTKDPLVNKVKMEMQEFLLSIDPKLSLHDFRMVPGEKQTNLVFDCLLPPCGYPDVPGLRKKISDYAKSLDPRYRVVVQFDNNFA